MHPNDRARQLHEAARHTDEAHSEDDTVLDTSAMSVAEVVRYLDEHPDEAEAVQAHEATSGKGRAGIANWQPY